VARETVAAANAGIDAKITTGTTYYLGLCTADPGITGANEVTGGSYARQAIVFGVAASAGSKASTTAQSFTGMPAVSVGFLCLFTGSTGANPVWGGALDTALTIPAGSTVNFAIGAVTATES
jgi:hypothetical protein